MINPVRSEQDAFRFTLVVAALVVPIVAAAIIFGSDVAAGVGLGLLIGCTAVVLLYRKRGEPEQKMLLGRPVGDRGDRRRILVVANETISGGALKREIEYRSRGYDADVRLICPALNSKLRHWTSDEDDARAAAQGRLNAMVSNLLSEGIRTEGQVGDAEPLQAIEDGLRRFPADEVIISTHPYGRSHWLERDVVSTARERFSVPITHVIVDIDREVADGPVATIG